MKVKVGYISHDEAMIQNFIEEPDYADFYLDSVLADGDTDEIALVQSWYDEAKARRMKNRLDNTEIYVRELAAVGL